MLHLQKARSQCILTHTQTKSLIISDNNLIIEKALEGYVSNMLNNYYTWMVVLLMEFGLPLYFYLFFLFLVSAGFKYNAK